MLYTDNAGEKPRFCSYPSAQNAIKVLKFLKEEEIRQVTVEIANAGKIDNETPRRRRRFARTFSPTLSGLVSAICKNTWQTSAHKAAAIIDRLAQGSQTRRSSLSVAPLNQLLNIIRRTCPDNSSDIFISESGTITAVLSALPREKQAEVAQRIATMDMTSPSTSEIERILKKKLSSLGKESYTASGGIQAIVDILNAADRSTEKSIFETLEVKDSELAEASKKRMFVFEDIINLDNKAVQLFLREIESHDLALALKSATEDVSERIFENMSKRMQEVLKEEIEFLGPVKLRDVEEAQQRIVSVIRRLEDEGEIIVSRTGGDEIIV